MRSSSEIESLAVKVNTSHLLSCTGLLKIIHLLLGSISTGILGFYMGNFAEFGKYFYSHFRPELYLLIVSSFALMTSLCLIVSSLLSAHTASLLPHTMFEMIYHLVAALLLFTGSVALLSVLNELDSSVQRPRNLEAKASAAVMSLINSVFYAWAFGMAVRSIRQR